MDALEREEFEYHLNARADYLSEAFGDEARLLAQQDFDDGFACRGFFSAAGAEAGDREWSARRRAANTIRDNHAGPVDDCPF